MATDKTQGLTCPNCSGVVPVPEGARVVECPFCQMRSLVRGERGVRRWQVTRQVNREQALEKVRAFFNGLNRARGLKKQAKIREVFLVYLPYWRVQALVAGWMLGRVKSGKNSSRPVEVQIQEEMHWNDAAVDVAEFGVHRVTISKQDLEPYDTERLHAEGMVFEPSESRTDAMAEAREHFVFRARKDRSMRSKFYEKIHLLRSRLSLVYYPLWVARYEFRERNYQVVVDARNGKVLYGKAPGNIFYRAAMLVGGMALGNLLLVNGTIIAGYITLFAGSGSDENPFWLVCLPFGAGLAIIAAAYSRFRYGEEVEERSGDSQKAAGAGAEKKASDVLKMGMSFIEELSELK